jgi:hypothetical protein
MDAMRVEADRMLVCARVRTSFEGELSGLCAVFDFVFPWPARLENGARVSGDVLTARRL